MSKDCQILNPLQRDGTSQRQRILAALSPDFVSVDERSIHDFLHYAYRYAQLIRFYNTQNQEEGDWTDFLEKDISILVSIVAHTSTQTFKDLFDTSLQAIRQANSGEERKLAFTQSLIALYHIANTLHNWQKKSIPGLKLHDQLSRLIASLIDDGFQQIIGYLERADFLGFPLIQAGGGDISIPLLKQSWPKGNIPLNRPPLSNGIPEAGKRLAAEILKLERIFKPFYKAMNAIVGQANDFLKESLEKYPRHEPYMALFLTFLLLFKISREHLNGITKRHLDFYYKQVLQLKNRPEIPDKVHVIFELAKGFDKKLLETDTFFPAGKDDTDPKKFNTNLFYASDEEIVVNRAQLDPDHGLKTIFIDKSYDNLLDENANPLNEPDVSKYEILNIYAAPKANTADGIAESLPEDDPKWATLGSGANPFAEVGFAIASPMLLLGEGERRVDLTFHFKNFESTIEFYGKSRIKNELNNNTKLYLTTEEGWQFVDTFTVDFVDDTAEPGQNNLLFSIQLSLDFPAVTPYIEEIHQAGFNTEYPVARFIFDNTGLETLGDLDLNLAGAVNDFDDNQQYLAGDLVGHVFVAGERMIYRSNVGIIGVFPTDEVPVWSAITIPDPVTSYASAPEEITQGLIVEYSDCLFRSNGNFNKSSVPEPIVPDPDTEVPLLVAMVWEELEGGEGNFDPRSTYEEGSLVSEDNILYQANAQGEISPIAPLKYLDSDNPSAGTEINSPLWREILEYAEIVYNRTALVQEDGIVYELNARTNSNINPRPRPNSEEQLWSLLDVIFQLSQEENYSIEDYAYNSEMEKLYQFTLIDEIEDEALTNVNPGGKINPDIWEPVSIYSAPTEKITRNTINYVFTENPTDEDDLIDPTNYEIYKPNPYLFLFNSSDINLLGRSVVLDDLQKHIADRQNNFTIWQRVEMFDPNRSEDYLKGTVVFEMMPSLTFYIARSNTQENPIAQNSPWQTLGSNFNSSYQGEEVNFGEILQISGVFYAVNIRSRAISMPSNLLSLSIWEQSNTIVELHQPDTLYENDSLVYILGDTDFLQIFVARARSQGIPPDPNSDPLTNLSIWTELVVLKDSNGLPFTENTFPLTLTRNSGIHFILSQIVSYSEVPGSINFYQANADNIGFLPDRGDLIWKERSDIEDYDPKIRYPANKIVQFISRFFVLNSSLTINQLAPSRSPLSKWLPGPGIAEYNSQTNYIPDQVVRVGNSFFNSLIFFRGIHPRSNVPIWEKIPKNPDSFSLEIGYSTGTYVIHNMTLFRANGEAKGIVPQSNDSLSKWLRIRDYNPQAFYNEGNYVILGRKVYQVKSVDIMQPILNQQLGIPGLDANWLLIDINIEKAEYYEEQGVDQITYSILFDNNLTYPRTGMLPVVVSEVVSYNNALFQVQPNQTIDAGLPPGEMMTLWEEFTKIWDYSPNINFKAGEYVYFLGSIYRPSKDVRGESQNPEKAPDLWSQVGIIREYNAANPYFENSHIRTQNGRVLRANRFIEADTEFNEADWEVVPGSYPYKYLVDPELESLDIDVEVIGMQNLILENDQGVLNASKPFFPFGTLPIKGSLFYIGSYEVFQKTLSNITLDIEWGDLPEENFAAYYKQYEESLSITFHRSRTSPPGIIASSSISNHPNINNDIFVTSFNVLQNGDWLNAGSEDSPLTSSTELLFITADTEGEEPSSSRNGLRIEFNPLNFRRNPNLRPFEQLTPGMSRGFLQLELEQDFFHEVYPSFLTKSALAQQPALIPKEPYTPLINTFKLSYTSSESIVFKGKSRQDFENPIERFFHIYPFGQAEFVPVKEETNRGIFTSPHLVPKFQTTVINPDGSIVEDETTNRPLRRDANGTLFIGLKELDPPQNVHILFQLAEGSEIAEHAGQRVVWSYLSHNRWVDFSTTEIISDDTNGLLRPGIIKFAMPNAMTNENTILPSGLHWIKGSVVNFANGVSQAIAVRPQAVKASYRNDNNDPNHLSEPLEAGKISQLNIRQAAIKSVEQPFISFGGRLEEQDDEFYLRVSERLRHKKRGVTIFDYERLVLEEFPKVHKVKCVNHTGQRAGSKTSEHLPGYVKLLVIPNPRNKDAPDRLKPVMSQNERDEIKHFLTGRDSMNRLISTPRISPFVNLEVTNPQYEEVRVALKVGLMPGRDRGFYQQQLQEDLILFLSPWIEEETAELVFGGKVNGAVVLNFIEELPYVDFILDFQLYHIVEVNGEICELKSKDNEVVASTSSSILVSASTHIIDTNIAIEEICPNPHSS